MIPTNPLTSSTLSTPLLHTCAVSQPHAREKAAEATKGQCATRSAIPSHTKLTKTGSPVTALPQFPKRGLPRALLSHSSSSPILRELITILIDYSFAPAARCDGVRDFHLLINNLSNEGAVRQHQRECHAVSCRIGKFLFLRETTVKKSMSNAEDLGKLKMHAMHRHGSSLSGPHLAPKIFLFRFLFAGF